MSLTERSRKSAANIIKIRFPHKFFHCFICSETQNSQACIKDQKTQTINNKQFYFEPPSYALFSYY